MSLTNEYVDKRIRALGPYRVRQAQAIGREGEEDGISGALILALGLRESDLNNILNAAGTDRGCFQISDVYHPAWLASVPGCVKWSWLPAEGKSALDAGMSPRFSDGARYAVSLLHDGLAAADELHIPEDDHVRFAVAAYNAGVGGAMKGYREGDVDKYTTGKNYSHDTLVYRTQVNKSAAFKAWTS